MFFKQNIIKVLVISCMAATVAVANNPDLFKRRFNMNVLNIITHSSDSIATNPKSALKCFEYYNPIIEEIFKNYEKDYDTCCNIADLQRNKTDEGCFEARKMLANKTEESCEALKLCKQMKLVKGEYECYIQEGNNNSKALHDISNKASAELSVYIQNLDVIKFNESRCTNKAREIYESESIVSYTNLKNCLLGLIEVPTTTTETPTKNPTTVTESTTNLLSNETTVETK